MFSFRNQLKILTAKWNDTFLHFLPAEPGHSVTVKPRTIHNKSGLQEARRGLKSHQIRALFYFLQTSREPNFGTGQLQQFTQLATHGGVVHDAGFRHVNRPNTSAVRFNLTQPVAIDDLTLHTVLQTTLKDGLQLRQLIFTSRHNHFARAPAGDVVLLTELFQLLFSVPAITGSQRTRAIINPRVHHARISSGLMKGQRRLFFQNRDPPCRPLLNQLPRCGQPHDSSANDDNIKLWHGRTRNPETET